MFRIRGAPFAHALGMKITTLLACALLIAYGVFAALFALTGFDLLALLTFGNAYVYRALFESGFVERIYGAGSSENLCAEFFARSEKGLAVSPAKCETDGKENIMETLKIWDLDYRRILLQSYKSWNLTEGEVLILLLIDQLFRESNPTLITGEQLAVRMTYSAEEIDKMLVSLMSKGFLSYEPFGDVLVTSLSRTYQKICDDFLKKATRKQDDAMTVKKEADFSCVMRRLETEMKRSLTSLETEKVAGWFQDDLSADFILQCIDECLMKGGKVTITKVDRTLLKNIAHRDRESEGATTVDERTKMDIRKAIDIANYDWMDDDK